MLKLFRLRYQEISEDKAAREENFYGCLCKDLVLYNVMKKS